MSAPYDAFRATRTFNAFDGLRGLLSIMIVWCHATGTMYAYGYACLSTFFIVSGFLIVTLLLRERDRYGEFSLKMFYARRTLRIFPLYYTIIIAYALAVLLLERDQAAADGFRENLPYFLTYTSNWFVNHDPDARVIFFFAWSLATEEQFYLIWPWIERFMRGWRPVAICLAMIGLDQAASAGCFGSWLPLGAAPHQIFTSVSTPICMGVVLAHVLHSRTGFGAVYRILGGAWTSSITFFVALAGVTLLYPHGVLGRFSQEIMLLLFVASCVVREDHHLNRILGLKFAMKLGVISYGTYLMHMLSINAARRLLGALEIESDLAIFALGYAVAITAAMISYHYYERFFMDLKSRFVRRAPDTTSDRQAGPRLVHPAAVAVGVGVEVKPLTAP